MDLIGYASYALPGLGELGDIIWAPISAIIFYRMFGGWKGAFGGMFNFVEEILWPRFHSKFYHYVGMATGKETGTDNRQSAMVVDK